MIYFIFLKYKNMKIAKLTKLAYMAKLKEIMKSIDELEKTMLNMDINTSDIFHQLFVKISNMKDKTENIDIDDFKKYFIEAMEQDWRSEPHKTSIYEIVKNKTLIIKYYDFIKQFPPKSTFGLTNNIEITLREFFIQHYSLKNDNYFHNGVTLFGGIDDIQLKVTIPDHYNIEFDFTGTKIIDNIIQEYKK